MPGTAVANLPLPTALADHAGAAAALLRSLANPHRLAILCLLGDGELSVGAINDRLQAMQSALSQSALSQHLAVLREQGLVSTRRDAQQVFYAVQPGPALDIIRVLHGHYCPQAGEA